MSSVIIKFFDLRFNEGRPNIFQDTLYEKSNTKSTRKRPFGI